MPRVRRQGKSFGSSAGTVAGGTDRMERAGGYRLGPPSDQCILVMFVVIPIPAPTYGPDEDAAREQHNG